MACFTPMNYRGFPARGAVTFILMKTAVGRNVKVHQSMCRDSRTSATSDKGARFLEISESRQEFIICHSSHGCSDVFREPNSSGRAGQPAADKAEIHISRQDCDPTTAIASLRHCANGAARYVELPMQV
jgi:hypothetical protein